MEMVKHKSIPLLAKGICDKLTLSIVWIYSYYQQEELGKENTAKTTQRKELVVLRAISHTTRTVGVIPT